ncbi:hypothetical protein LINPERHAP2_LOCUS31484, partial [Linum perenne]
SHHHQTLLNALGRTHIQGSQTHTRNPDSSLSPIRPFKRLSPHHNSLLLPIVKTFARYHTGPLYN